MTSPNLPQASNVAWDHVTRAGVLVMAAGVLVTGLIYFARVLEPLVVAVFVFFALRPIARFAGRHGISPLLTYMTLLVVVAVGAVAIAQILVNTARDFLEESGAYREKLMALVDWVARLTGRADDTGRFDWENESIAELLEIDPRVVFEQLIDATTRFIEAALMFFFYLVFLVIEAEKLPRRIRAAVSAKTAADVHGMAETAASEIQGYLFIKTWVSLGMGLSAGLIMWLFELDYWPLWVLLIVIFNYVTYLGSIVAILPPVAIGLLQFWPDWPLAVGLTALLIINRTLWIDYLEIQFAGRKLNISPVLLLLALALGGSIWGLVGLVLAVPIMTAIKIGLGTFESTRPYSILMSEDTAD